MGIPVIYRNSAEPAIASYNYIDVAEGTGTIVFYGYTTAISTGTLGFALNSNSVYSNNVITTDAVGTTYAEYTGVDDLDFDVVFNMPQQIKGNAKVSLTIGANSTNTPGDKRIFATVRLRKWDGTTETEIANADTEVLTHNAATGIKSKTMLINLPITSQVNFKKGDTLRITIQTFIKKTQPNGNLGFAHDPKDRNDDGTNVAQIIADTDTTIMAAHIPFVLNI